MLQIRPSMEVGLQNKAGCVQALQQSCCSRVYLSQPALVLNSCISQLHSKPLQRTALTRARHQQGLVSQSSRCVHAHCIHQQSIGSVVASSGAKRRGHLVALRSDKQPSIGSCGWNVERIRRKSERAHTVHTSGRCKSFTAAGGVRSSSDYVRVSSTLQTDIPFPEVNEVPLEQYMTETQRIFAAVFPDTHRAQRLSPEVWRIFMLPINFLFLSVRPVVDMRVWLHDPAKDGPPSGSMATAGKAKKLVCLEAVRCELKGLDYVLKRDDFILGANGALHPEKSGAATRMRGSMHVSVSLAIPPALIFTPKGLLESAGSAVLEQVLRNMKDKVNSQLLLDYRAYAREEAIKRTRQ